MILCHYIQSENKKTERNDKQNNTYDMLKITLKDTYSNSEKKLKAQMRKYRNYTKTIKKLETEISSSLAKFQEYKNQNIEKTLKTINNINPDYCETLFSTCETETNNFIRERTRSKYNPDFFQKEKDNEIKYNKYYKLFYQKMNQITELNKSINQNYENDIKSFIKIKSRYKSEITSNSLNNISSNDLYDKQEENELVSFVACGSSRKIHEKKNECIII